VKRTIKILNIAVATVAAALMTGCGGLWYGQESGFHSKFPKDGTNNVSLLEVYYTNGELYKITYYTTNAYSVDVADLSRAKGLSVIAKSSADELVGNRKGTYKNDSGVKAAGVATEERLSSVITEAAKLKNPLK
tara:strand:- start:34830 stop:35231 length:402 start_codon:yes stop_codon:yes gene_type:complete